MANTQTLRIIVISYAHFPFISFSLLLVIFVPIRNSRYQGEKLIRSGDNPSQNTPCGKAQNLH